MDLLTKYEANTGRLDMPVVPISRGINQGLKDYTTLKYLIFNVIAVLQVQGELQISIPKSKK